MAIALYGGVYFACLAQITHFTGIARIAHQGRDPGPGGTGRSPYINPMRPLSHELVMAKPRSTAHSSDRHGVRPSRWLGILLLVILGLAASTMLGTEITVTAVIDDAPVTD